MSETNETQACNYWMSRISYEGDVAGKLLEAGYLSIGWSYFCDKGVEKDAQKNDRKAFQKKTEGWSRSRWSLWHFCSFNVGDIVIVPLYGGLFSVYRVKARAQSIREVAKLPEAFDIKNGRDIYRRKDGLYYDKNPKSEDKEQVDLGFVVAVEPIRLKVSRYDHADAALTSRLKYRGVTCCLNDLAASVQTALTAQEAPHKVIGKELAKKLCESIQKKLNDAKFEKLVKWYFERIGATNVWIPAKNEPGKEDGADVDVVADFETLKTMYYVQVKFHQGATSDWAVAQVQRYQEQHAEALDEDATAIAWAITSADTFSESAIAAAKDAHVRLINGMEFAEMLLNVGLDGFDNAFKPIRL